MQAGAKRLVAIKTRISDIHASAAVSDPTGPTGLLLPTGETAYRVNLIGAVVSQPEIGDTNAAFVMDDGSGSMVIRTFENPARLSTLSIGGIVTVVGRPRPSAEGIFIAPEIIKATSPAWLNVRRKELESLPRTPPIQQAKQASATTSLIGGSRSTPGSMSVPLPKLGAVEEEVVIDQPPIMSSERKITELIKKHDSGNGADAALVLASAGVSNGDALIEKLLKNGDIFAVGPGRYKVLD